MTIATCLLTDQLLVPHHARQVVPRDVLMAVRRVVPLVALMAARLVAVSDVSKSWWID